MILIDFNYIKTKSKSTLIEEEEVKKNPKISDAGFEVVGQYQPPYYSDEVEVIGRLKPFKIDVRWQRKTEIICRTTDI